MHGSFANMLVEKKSEKEKIAVFQKEYSVLSEVDLRGGMTRFSTKTFSGGGKRVFFGVGLIGQTKEGAGDMRKERELVHREGKTLKGKREGAQKNEKGRGAQHSSTSRKKRKG